MCEPVYNIYVEHASPGAMRVFSMKDKIDDYRHGGQRHLLVTELCRGVTRDLSTEEKERLFYVDEENDPILLRSEHDWEEALKCLLKMQKLAILIKAKGRRSHEAWIPSLKQETTCAQGKDEVPEDLQTLAAVSRVVTKMKNELKNEMSEELRAQLKVQHAQWQTQDEDRQMQIAHMQAHFDTAIQDVMQTVHKVQKEVSASSPAASIKPMLATEKKLRKAAKELKDRVEKEETDYKSKKKAEKAKQKSARTSSETVKGSANVPPAVDCGLCSRACDKFAMHCLSVSCNMVLCTGCAEADVHPEQHIMLRVPVNVKYSGTRHDVLSQANTVLSLIKKHNKAINAKSKAPKKSTKAKLVKENDSKNETPVMEPAVEWSGNQQQTLEHNKEEVHCPVVEKSVSNHSRNENVNCGIRVVSENCEVRIEQACHVDLDMEQKSVVVSSLDEDLDYELLDEVNSIGSETDTDLDEHSTVKPLSRIGSKEDTSDIDLSFECPRSVDLWMSTYEMHPVENDGAADEQDDLNEYHGNSAQNPELSEEAYDSDAVHTAVEPSDDDEDELTSDTNDQPEAEAVPERVAVEQPETKETGTVTVTNNASSWADNIGIDAALQQQVTHALQTALTKVDKTSQVVGRLVQDHLSRTASTLSTSSSFEALVTGKQAKWMPPQSNWTVPQGWVPRGTQTEYLPEQVAAQENTAESSASSATASGVAAVSGQYQEQLQQLADMGFTETEHNRLLLEQSQGDMARVVDLLISGFELLD